MNKLPLILLLFLISSLTATAQVFVNESDIIISSPKEQYFCEPIISSDGCLVKTTTDITNNRLGAINPILEFDANQFVSMRTFSDQSQSIQLVDPRGYNIKSVGNHVILSGETKTYEVDFWIEENGKYNFSVFFSGTRVTLDPFFNVSINATAPSLYLSNGTVNIFQDFEFGNTTEISAELSDDLDATDFLITTGGLLNNTLNFTDGSAENTQFLTAVNEMFEVNITILDTSSITNFEACFRASTGSGAADPNLTINEAFTGILLDFPTGNAPDTDTCVNVPLNLISNGSQRIGMGCTSCGNPVNNRNYLDTDVSDPNNNSFFYNGVLTPVLVEDYMIWFIIETDTDGFAIKSNFNHTIDTSNDYWLRARMTTPTTTDANVHIYINQTDIDPSFTTQTLMTGENVINLNSILTNQSNSTFRLYTNSIARISELTLIEGINDTINPIIQNCAVNTTLLTCGGSVRLSCNVTDDNFLNNVYFSWDDLTSNNEFVNRILNTDIFFKDITYNHNTSGAINIFNFTSANATDEVGNFVIEPQNLQFNYSCGEDFDITPPSVVHTNLLLGFNLTTIDKTQTNLSINAFCYDDNAHTFSIAMFNSSDIVFNVTNTTLLTNTNLSITQEIDITNVAVGSYTGHSICIDNRSNIAFRSETIIINDFSAITLLSPDNNSVVTVFDNPAELGTVDFSFSLTQQSTCSLLFNGTVENTGVFDAGTPTITGNFPDNSTTSWNISCTTISSSIEIPSPEFRIISVIRTPVIQRLEAGVCTSGTANTLLLGLLVVISLAVLSLGFAFNRGFVTIFGALMLMTISWLIAACFAIFALILGLFSIVMIIYSVVANIGFKNGEFN